MTYLSKGVRKRLAEAWEEGATAMHEAITEAIGYNPGGMPDAVNPYLNMDGVVSDSEPLAGTQAQGSPEKPSEAPKNGSDGQSSLFAPDGYRYGVMFADGSVQTEWTGASQRGHAEMEVARRLAEQQRYLDAARSSRKPEGITLARRSPDGDWERVE